MDSAGYAEKLIKTAALPFADILRIVDGFFSGTTVDIIEPLSRFLISRFTNDPTVYFAFWTGLMGFFYLKTISLLHDRCLVYKNWTSYIVLGFFICIAPITTITGIRMPTAMWIFFYGAYHVVLYRDKRYLLLTLSACLVHWSFATANAVLFIYYFVGNRNIIYIPLTVLSFIVPNLLAPVFKTLANSAGGAVQNRYKGYSNKDYVASMQDSYEGASWFLILFENLIMYCLLAIIIIIQLRYRHIMKSKSERNLFSFTLLFLSFANFGKIIPSFGGRFSVVFYLLATLYIYIFTTKQRTGVFNFVKLIGIFPMLLFSAVQFRIGSESINTWIFYPGLGLSKLISELSLTELLF